MILDIVIRKSRDICGSTPNQQLIIGQLYIKAKQGLIEEISSKTACGEPIAHSYKRGMHGCVGSSRNSYCMINSH